MNRTKRIDLEEKLLRKTFGPTFRFQEAEGGVVGRIPSNAGNLYTLWLDLHTFPDDFPPAYIVDPVLKNKAGRKLAEASHGMHTRERNEHGQLQICHTSSEAWSTQMSLTAVVLKLRIWIEAYEAHLKSGRPIADLLPDEDIE